MKHKFSFGVMFVCICLSMIITIGGRAFADEVEVVAPESASSEVSVAPEDRDTSQGIMEDDIIVIEEEVVEENRKLAPNPTYNEQTPTYEIEDVPETSDAGMKMNSKYLLLSGWVVVTFFVIASFKNKKSVNL